MESLFETLLTLIPLALIVALRIAASRKERQRVQAQTRGVDILKTKAAKPVKVLHQKQAYKPAFKFEESANPPIARWDDIPQAKHWALSSTPELIAPDLSPMAEPSPMKHAFPSDVINSKAIHDEKLELFRGLSKLSRLQQAVIYAELLGPPKGMQP